LSKISKNIDSKTDSFNRLPETIEPIDIVNFKYASANSVDVEHFQFTKTHCQIIEGLLNLKICISKIIVVQCNLDI